MIRTKSISTAILLACCTATAASATHFAGPFTVDANTTDPGLMVNIDSFTPLSFDLTTGNTITIDLFTISTGESDVGRDDQVAKPISVDFSFTSPSGAGGSIGGTTIGEKRLLGALQNGRVKWDGPTTFDFGSAGVLSVSLNDATFGKGVFGLSGSSATISGTFSLEGGSPVDGVPEPASWALMLTGFGAVGGALRMSRRQSAVSFG